jgi:hypothetical protein
MALTLNWRPLRQLGLKQRSQAIGRWYRFLLLYQCRNLEPVSASAAHCLNRLLNEYGLGSRQATSDALYALDNEYGFVVDEIYFAISSVDVVLADSVF